MNGFLHQLAARSLGLTPAIHPRAALPYSTPLDDPTAGDFTPLNPLNPPPASADPPSSASPASARQAPQPLVGEAGSKTTRAPADDFQTAASPAPAPISGKPLALANPSPPVISDKQPLPTRSTTPLTPGSERTAKLESLAPTPVRQAATPASPAPTTHQPAPPETAQPAPKPTNRDLESLIARLVQPNHTAAAAPETRPATQAPLPTAAFTKPPSASAEPAPEVHITIGRLEVNPPPRPAPPPAPRPRGPAPLSLADYLARRNGGRP